jgi:plasmid replication initiation protein
MAIENTKGIVKKSIKRKERIVLPGSTEIYQTNRITNGKFNGFTLIQTKLLVGIIKGLQDAIKFNMSGNNWEQLELFKPTHEGLVRVGIFLSEIARPDQYKEVIQAGKEMQTLQIKLKRKIDDKEYIGHTSLITVFNEPRKINGRSVVFIDMLKDVAKQVIDIDKNAKGIPAHYTKYLYEVALQARCKYTPKLYMLLSSWKSKGGAYFTLPELKTQLGIGEEEYSRYADFKKFVLIPVQKDLEKKSDIWFNCKASDFEMRKGKEVIGISFKIIVPEFEIEMEQKADYIRQMLRLHFQLNDSLIQRIAPIFSNMDSQKYASIVNKIQDIKTHINSVENTEDQIKEKPAYVATSLLNEFKE